MSIADTYTARALAALRYRLAPRPHEAASGPTGNSVAQRARADVRDDEATQYADELIRRHEMATHDWQDCVDEDDDACPPSPDMFADELARVSKTISELEGYRRCLIVFGDQYATSRYSQRQLASLAGLNPTRVNRWLKQSNWLRQEIHEEVRPLAAEAVQSADLTQLDTDEAAGLTDWLCRLLHVARNSTGSDTSIIAAGPVGVGRTTVIRALQQELATEPPEGG